MGWNGDPWLGEWLLSSFGLGYPMTPRLGFREEAVASCRYTARPIAGQAAHKGGHPCLYPIF